MGRSSRVLWGALAVLVLLGAVLVWLGPDEQTIGKGIKAVYVHVALTWAGQTGLVAAGALGLAALLLSRPAWQAWSRVIGWVALGVLACGTAVSLLAEVINWNGIAWQEPRTVSALQLLAVALIVNIGGGWLNAWHWRALLSALLAGYMAWLLLVTPLVLHPGNAVGASSSVAIQATFYGLFALCMLVEALLAWRWRPVT